jgi:hypothetical protein
VAIGAARADGVWYVVQDFSGWADSARSRPDLNDLNRPRSDIASDRG